MSVPADRARPPVVFTGGVAHPAGNPFCPHCFLGYPRACVCGGWVHASGAADGLGEDADPAVACGWCGADARPAEPLGLSGDSHAPGRADCPACAPGAVAPCVCGGLIHQAPDGARRCDRCGPRCEDLDV